MWLGSIIGILLLRICIRITRWGLTETHSSIGSPFFVACRVAIVPGFFGINLQYNMVINLFSSTLTKCIIYTCGCVSGLSPPSVDFHKRPPLRMPPSLIGDPSSARGCPCCSWPPFSSPWSKIRLWEIQRSRTCKPHKLTCTGRVLFRYSSVGNAPSRNRLAGVKLSFVYTRTNVKRETQSTVHRQNTFAEAFNFKARQIKFAIKNSISLETIELLLITTVAFHPKTDTHFISRRIRCVASIESAH